MARRHLTAAAVSRIRPPPVGQVDHFDAGYPGLALRVSYGGSRSWVYFYRWQGKQKRLTLGPWPAVELAQAREAWREARNRLSKGLEPIAKPDIAADDSFASVVEDWLKRDQAENRSRHEVERILRREVLPTWGRLRVSEISRRQVLDLIDRIADRGAATLARRCHAYLHRLFRWSVGRGVIEANPMADLPKPGEEVKRTRVLSDKELAHAWKAAGQVGWPMGSAIQLLILTAARREEIGALEWREIDIARNEIRLEGTRTKNGEPHTIPLSAAAQQLIEGLPRMSGGKFVFTTTGTTAISGWSRAKDNLDKFMLESAEKAAQERGEDSDEVGIVPWRIHDLRRTAATGLERLGIRLQVVEALLGHITGSRAGVVGIYQRHDYASEKREAIEKWAAHVASLAGGAQ
jgi:integrase